MKADSDRSVACRRSKLIFPSPNLSARYNQGKKQHPFHHGALVTKDQVRAFHRPSSEVRLALSTAMWLQMGLNQLPISHPTYSLLLDRLQKEPPSPSCRSCSSQSRSPPEKTVIRFDQLPAEIRNLIYKYSLPEHEPICPVLKSEDEGVASSQSHYIETGLPILHRVFPNLAAEIKTMLRPFYQANTFQFDLREEDGVQNLLHWVETRPHEAHAARTISVIHWTWYWNTSNSCWHCVPDATVLSLTSNGRVKLSRTASFLSHDACNCEMDDLVSAQCSDWIMNKTWTMTDFVKALRQDEELLTQALMKFVSLIEHYDESLHAWRYGPKACTGCGKLMVFLRTFDDVEWTSE